MSALHFFLGTRNNEFHFQSHPDEISKIVQIIKGERNMHHPLFMLNSVNASMRTAAKFIPKRYPSTGSIEKKISPQDCAVIGRNMSAFYSAAGVLCASLALGVSWSWLAGVCAALFLGLSPLTIILAHFLKEDASLSLGMGAFLLAAAWHANRRSRTSAALLGIASGLLLSTKWIGISLAVGYLGISLLTDRSAPAKSHWRWLAGFFVLAICVINFQMILNPGETWSELERETSKLGGGAFEEEASVGFYGMWYAEYIGQEVMHWAFPLALAGAAVCLLGKLGPLPRALCGAMVIQTLCLGFSKATSTRYVMPSVFYINFMAAVGIACLVLWAIQKRHWLSLSGAATGLLAAVLLTFEQCERTGQALQDFKLETVQTTWNWIRENLAGKNAMIVQFDRNRLPGDTWIADPTTPPLPVKTLTISRGDTVHTYEELKSMGATHLIMRPLERKKIFRLDDEQLEKKRNFTEELSSKATLVFSIDTGPIFWCQPALEIYELK